MKVKLSLLLLFIPIFIFAQAGLTKENQSTQKILFVVSNANFHGESEIYTANQFYEIILPYDEFVKAGYEVDFVSPEGGPVPIGYLSSTNSTSEKYLYDFDFMAKLKNTKAPDQIKAKDYSTIFYCGGGAAMYGVPENTTIQKIAMQIYEEEEGIVGAICHGAAGIVNLKTSDNKYLVDGKKVNGYPDLFEDMEAAYYKNFPFSIEQVIKDRGGDFQFSKEGWDGFMQEDGRLITAQDPSGSRKVAKSIIAALAKSNGYAKSRLNVKK